MYTITVQTVPYQREASPTKPLTDYSIWYDPFAQWMGLFVQTMNPWFHAANYAWVTLIVAIGYAGYRTERDQRLH